MTTTIKTRKRGRPPAFDRSQAIDIALDLFWKKGYDSVGVAELGDAIGIKPPSLYKAFGSKHGLFDEAVRRYADEDKGGFLGCALAETVSLEDAISSLLLQAAKSYSSRNKIPGCLVLSGTSNCTDSEALATTAAQRHATKAYLADVFTSHGADDANSLADYVLIAMTGLSSAARQGVKRNTLIKAAKRFAQLSL